LLSPTQFSIHGRKVELLGTSDARLLPGFNICADRFSAPVDRRSGLMHKQLPPALFS
jgi:hypothetical protein